MKISIVRPLILSALLLSAAINSTCAQRVMPVAHVGNSVQVSQRTMPLQRNYAWWAAAYQQRKPGMLPLAASANRSYSTRHRPQQFNEWQAGLQQRYPSLRAQPRPQPNPAPATALPPTRRPYAFYQQAAMQKMAEHAAGNR
ncbi:MAG TPA: hypothetical protein VL307_16905 [Chitinophagaceae bacterium]|nr:hypothetical protein [Chitinophagaceae bacterium]